MQKAVAENRFASEPGVGTWHGRTLHSDLDPLKRIVTAAS
jgi:hypothetical protein